jgi:hypothetical protein
MLFHRSDSLLLDDPAARSFDCLKPATITSIVLIRGDARFKQRLLAGKRRKLLW